VRKEEAFSEPAPQPAFASWPSATFRERSWRWCGFGLWIVATAKLWISALLPGWTVLGVLQALVVSAASLGLVTWFWQRRRLGVRVDDVGVHELFPGRRVVSHPWPEIRKIIQTGDTDYRLYTEGSVVLLTGRLARVGILAEAIRARLKGPTPPAEAQTDQPSPEQVAAWLGVSPEELPLIFIGLGDWEVLVVSTLTAASFLTLWFLGLNLWLVVLIWWGLWGYFLSHPLPIRVELGVEGVAAVDLFGRRQSCAWMDLLRFRGRTLRGRYGSLVIPGGIQHDLQLFRLLRQALAHRGEVPTEGFSPRVLIPDAALSRVKPDAPPAATERSLSQAQAEAEEAPRLTEAVSEEAAEGEELKGTTGN